MIDPAAHAATSPRLVGPPWLAEAVAASTEPVPVPGAEITMPEGLVGFPSHQRFALLPCRADDHRLMTLRALLEPAFGFVVLTLPPSLWANDGELVDACRERRIEPADLLALVVVTLRSGGVTPEGTVNLRAPLIVDARRRLGWQVVLRNPGLSVKAPLRPAS